METIIVRDPVCGMEIYPDNAAGTSVYEGQIYYFCSPGCKEAFDKEPERYVGQSDTEQNPTFLLHQTNRPPDFSGGRFDNLNFIARGEELPPNRIEGLLHRQIGKMADRGG